MERKVIRAAFFLFILVTLLPNTVNAEAVVGPPIGEDGIEFSPSDTVLPGKAVTVTIEWRITNESYENYDGPFNLHIKLRDSDGNKIDDWTIHTTDYTILPNIYQYSFTRNVPNEVGTYSLAVQIVASGLESEVGNSGNYHCLLVASGEGSITAIPEFPTTIALPAAVIFGLFFLFNYNKRKK